MIEAIPAAPERSCGTFGRRARVLGGQVVAEAAHANLEDLLSLTPANDAAELRGAMEQVRAYMNSFDSPGAMLDSLQVFDDEIDDEYDMVDPDDDDDDGEDLTGSSSNPLKLG